MLTRFSNKKHRLHVLFVAMLTLFYSCSETDQDDTFDSSQSACPSSLRSVEEAIAIANDAAGMTQSLATRSLTKTADTQNVEIITGRQTRSTSSNDTLLYVVNYTGGQGFAVISARRDKEGLLAVTEKGSFSSDSLQSGRNEGLRDFMQMAQIYATSNSRSISNISDTIYKRKLLVHQIDTLHYDSNSPKVAVQWGQTEYEGAYCPNKIAGCSNVAMGQIMSYFCFPTSLTIDYDSTNVTTLTLDWDALKTHKTSHSYASCTASQRTHEALGKLMRQLGKLNKSIYGATGTSTYASDVRNSFMRLGYGVSSLLNYDGGDFDDEFSEGKLIYMRGTSDEGGHAWVVDGNMKLSIHEADWVIEEGSIIRTLYKDYGIREVSYIHINWGWYGYSNGYFYPDVLSTQEAYSYDNNRQTASNYDFNASVMYFEVSK